MKDHVMSIICVILVVAGIVANRYPLFAITCVIGALVVTAISLYTMLRGS